MCSYSEMALGSSPRMRGKHAREYFDLGRYGLIPAYAGKTRAAVRESRTRRAHPRVCGENHSVCAAQRAGSGSSPRMRGKRSLGRGDTLVVGLIPAYAGKTVRWGAIVVLVGAHPRVCGENGWHVFMGTSPRGSSPRMRGKLYFVDPTLCRAGLIPAYAGKTASRWRLRATRRAHPRVCGEN